VSTVVFDMISNTASPSMGTPSLPELPYEDSRSPDWSMMMATIPAEPLRAPTACFNASMTRSSSAKTLLVPSGASGAGRTLAVGACSESSAARGIDGNRSNNNAPASGAVYLY